MELSEDVVMSMFVQLCLGIGHLHEHGVVHRDVKPANVFLSRSRKVRA